MKTSHVYMKYKHGVTYKHTYIYIYIRAYTQKLNMQANFVCHSMFICVCDCMSVYVNKPV